MFLNRCYENEAMMNNMGNMNNSSMADMGMATPAASTGANYNAMGDMSMMTNQGCCQNNMCPPVIECPQERVVCRELCYEVPQVSPFL